MLGLPTSVFCNETGLSKSSLCQWEARYGFPNPKRMKNAQGTKLYSQEDVVKVGLMRSLRAKGYPLEHTAAKEVSELRKMLKEIK